MMRRYFIFLLLPVLIQFSCVATKHLPSPREFKDHVYGLHLEGTIVDDSTANTRVYEVAGEIIAVVKDTIFLRINTNQIVRYEKSNFANCKVQVATTSNNPKAIALWAGFLNLIPASHGIIAFISVPVNLAVTIPIAVDANKGTYLMTYPQDVSWEELKKFARFPQGLPEGFLISRSN